MTRMPDKGPAVQPQPVRVSRVLAAPRELVFKAWSSAEHVKRWFAPTGFSVPHAKVEMRVGGVFEILMRAPDGVEHWARGTFAEVSPVDRLVLDLRVEDARGNHLFRAYTEVSLADAEGGTRIEAVQTYTLLDPGAAWMTSGAPTGWAQTLDKLAEEVARMQDTNEAKRSVV